MVKPIFQSSVQKPMPEFKDPTSGESGEVRDLTKSEWTQK
jgi:hypothetical protein